MAFEQGVVHGEFGMIGRRSGVRDALTDGSCLPPRVYLALVRQLYAASTRVALGSAAAAIFIGGIAGWRAADPWLTVLALAAGLLMVGLLPLKQAFWRRADTIDAAAARVWERRWILVSGSYSFAVGAFAARAYHASDHSAVHMIALAICLAGAATVLRSFVRPLVLVTQLGGMLVLPLLALAATGEPIYIALAIAGAALLSNIGQIGLNLYSNTVVGLERNACFHAALDNMTHGLSMFGPDHRLLVCNGRYLDMFGFSADVVRPGVSMRDLLEYSVAVGNHPPEAVDDLHTLFTETLAGAETAFLHRVEGGTTFMVTHRPMADGGWVATFEDITDRLAAEARLRESEEHYRHRVELDPQVPWTVDGNGQTIEISSRWTEYTGQSREDALGRGWLRIVHPDDLPKVLEDSRRAARARSMSDIRFRCRAADGNYRWFRARGYPLLNADGRIERWYGYSEDIDDKVQADERLRESERKLATLVANLPGMVYRCTARVPWPLEYVSEGTEALTGYAASDFTGGTLAWAEITHPEDVVAVKRTIDQAIRSGRNFSMTYRIMHRSGEIRWVFERGQPVIGPDGTVVALEGFIGDMTDRIAAEAKLRRLQAELLQVSRVSAMGAMGAAIAHELNQPLAAASNYAAAVRLLLSRANASIDHVRDVVGHLNDEVLRAGEIIRRLRNLAASGEAQVADEDLAELIEDSNAPALAGARELDVTCRFELARSLVVSADRVQVQQVLLNLVRNAVEAMRGSERRELVISAKAADGEAVIVVEDSGAGLTEEVKANLFAPFTTTKSGGMGIGLAICRAIIEAHGGRIWAEDVAAGGTRFCLTLPLASTSRRNRPVFKAPSLGDQGADIDRSQPPNGGATSCDMARPVAGAGTTVGIAG